MTDAGVMVTTNLAVEPIAPLGMLAEGGCQISWKKGGVKVMHPTKGTLPISIQAGCPQIPKELALDLIKEFENKSLLVKQARMAVEVHPRMVAVHGGWTPNFGHFARTPEEGIGDGPR